MERPNVPKPRHDGQDVELGVKGERSKVASVAHVRYDAHQLELSPFGTHFLL